MRHRKDGLFQGRYEGVGGACAPDAVSHASLWAERPIERVCQAAGIEGLTFHDLRHEATSRFFEQGFNLMEVAAITGHNTLSMLKRYTHLCTEDLAKRLR